MPDPFALSTQYSDSVSRTLDESRALATRVDRGNRFRMEKPGIEASNQIRANEATESNMQLSVKQQASKLLENPQALGEEFGELKTPLEMRKWISRHAAVSVLPLGEKLMDRFNQIATATEQAEIHSIDKQLELATAKKRAELMAAMIDGGYDPKNPQEVAAFRAEQSQKSLRAEAQNLGKDVTGLILKDDLDAQGRFVLGARDRILASSPRSEALLSREQISANAFEYRRLVNQANSDLEAGRINNQTYKLQLERARLILSQTSQDISAANLGYAITGRPEIPLNSNSTATPGSTNDPVTNSTATPGSINGPVTNSVKLVPIPRQSTTATTGVLQKAIISADDSLRALDEGLDAVVNNPDALGIRGILGSAIEKAQGQIDPNAPVSTRITEARQKLSLQFSSIAKSLRVDSGNMSRYELNKLEQAGDVLSWTESAQTAAAKIRNLQSAMIGKKLRTMKGLNSVPENSFLNRIPSSEVLDLVNDGLLSEQDALRWHKLHQ